MVIINPNKEFVEEMRQALQNNDGYCPCNNYHSPDTKCMCKEFQEMDVGMCHCGLYMKIPDEKDQKKIIPVQIKYHDKNIEQIHELAQGDMYDLRAAETVHLQTGEYKAISLGISIKMPKEYTCWIIPRSSTFKNFRILQTNSVGCIDNSYSGTNDILHFPALAMQDTCIKKGDRICQMCVTPRPPRLKFCEVDTLDEVDRGGFGSTGAN